MKTEHASREWTEGRVFAYFESEDFKGLAGAINAALAATEETATLMERARLSGKIIQLENYLAGERFRLGEIIAAERERYYDLQRSVMDLSHPNCKDLLQQLTAEREHGRQNVLG